MAEVCEKGTKGGRGGRTPEPAVDRRQEAGGKGLCPKVLKVRNPKEVSYSMK